MNSELQSLIKEIDWEIKMQRLYLHKEHKKGVFDFQSLGTNFTAFSVKSKIIMPIIERKLKKINDKFTSPDTVSIPREIRFLRSLENWEKDFLNHGVLYSTTFLLPDNELIHTLYYRNLEPQTYRAVFNAPNSPKEKEAWQEVHAGLGRSSVYCSTEQSLTITTYGVYSKQAELLKQHNPQSFKRSTGYLTLPLEKLNNSLTWKETRTLINILIQKLDDTCVNILNRADIVNYLVNNAQSIIQLLSNITETEKEDFKYFYEKEKDWFYLLPQALDLTENRYYKKIVDEEYTQNTAKTLHEIVQFMALQITINEKKSQVKKLKI